MAYVDGFVAAVPNTGKDDYLAFAEKSVAVFKRHGALEIAECWGDDVPEGKVTSFPMAVQCADDETVVFSWIIWPSTEVRDEGMQAVIDDPDMVDAAMPFDGKRMIFGGFELMLRR